MFTLLVTLSLIYPITFIYLKYKTIFASTVDEKNTFSQLRESCYFMGEMDVIKIPGNFNSGLKNNYYKTITPLNFSHGEFKDFDYITINYINSDGEKSFDIFFTRENFHKICEMPVVKKIKPRIISRKIETVECKINGKNIELFDHLINLEGINKDFNKDICSFRLIDIIMSNELIEPNEKIFSNTVTIIDNFNKTHHYDIYDNFIWDNII